MSSALLCRVLPLLVLLLPGCRSQRSGGLAAGPNLLLVTVDTLRTDHLGAYGYSRATSPNIDALAGSGALFERVYAQRGSTWPSLASILSSQYPVQHGVRSNGMKLSSDGGDSPVTTLAEVLCPRGYHCGAILTNAYEAGWEGFPHVSHINREPKDQRATEEVRRFLEMGAPEPFFLWVHYIAPHDPWSPPEVFQGFQDPSYEGNVDGGELATTRAMLGAAPFGEADLAQLNALYDGEIASTDAFIGEMLQILEQRGMRPRTLVALSADHGEELFEHHDYLFHNASVYEQVLRIPLILQQPGALPQGWRDATQADSLDIAPTLLDLLGIPAPEAWEGHSLLPLLAGEELQERPSIAELEDRVLTVRTPQHRYVWNPSGYQPPKLPGVRLRMAGVEELSGANVFPLEQDELYDLQQDPLEQHNIAAQDPTTVAALRQLLAAFRDRYRWRIGEGSPLGPLDPDLREKLEAMGYYIPAEGSGQAAPRPDQGRP